MRDRISLRPRSMGTGKGRDDAGGSSSCGPAVTTVGPASIIQSAQRFDGVVYAFVPRSGLERAPFECFKKIRLGRVPGKKTAGPADRIAGPGTGSHPRASAV